jgi:hypothetical protein
VLRPYKDAPGSNIGGDLKKDLGGIVYEGMLPDT